MEWRIAEIRKGPRFPARVAWLQDEKAFIPLRGELAGGEEARGRELLECRFSQDDQWRPLVWESFSAAGKIECAVDAGAWLHAMRMESYRPEHSMPLRAKLPFNYHKLPSWIRFHLVKLIASGKLAGVGALDVFPVSQFNVGAEIFFRCLAPLPPEGSLPAVVITHDVETEHDHAGLARMVEIEEGLGFRSCWNFVPKRHKLDGRLMAGLLDSGHEICMHGIWHNNSEPFLPPERLRRELDTLKSFISEYRVKGYRSPSWYRTKSCFDVLGDYFEYDMTCLDIDILCPGEPGGVGLSLPFHIRKNLVELPCSLVFDAGLYIDLPPSRWLEYWKRKIDFIGASKGYLVMNSHPDPAYCGGEAALAAYKDLLKYVSGPEWRRMTPGEAAAEAKSGGSLGDYLNPMVSG